jgi:hypothetical protein
MRHMLFVLVLLLPGCAAPPDVTIPGADGKKHILVRCRDTQNCLIRAARYCPGGYNDSNQGQRPHELLIRCKDAPEDKPVGWN